MCMEFWIAPANVYKVLVATIEHPTSMSGGFKYELQHGLTRRETPRGVS